MKSPAAQLRRSIAGALRLAWDASPRGFLTTALLSVLSGAGPPVVVWLSKRLVDLVVAGAASGRPPPALGLTVVALGLAGSGNRALAIFQGHRQMLFAERVGLAATRRFLAQAAAVDQGHFDDPEWHDAMRRAEEGLGFRPYQLAQSVTGLGGTVVTVLGMLTLLLSLHPVVVVLALASVLPVLIAQNRSNRRIYAFYFNLTPDQREHRYVQGLLSDPEMAKEVRAFGLGNHLLSRHRQLGEDIYRRQVGLYRRADRSAVLAGLLSGSAMAVAYGFVAARGTAGQLTAGDLAALLAAITSITQQTGVLASTVAVLDQHARFLSDYFAFLAIEPMVPTPDRPIPLPASLESGLEFRSVTFTYPGGTEPALAEVSLTVRPGEVVALVGDNGAGKTTLVKLLLRLYDPQRGTVRLGGVDLRDTDPAEVRTRVGVLFQDYARYQLSARDNVTLGRVERPVEDGIVGAALAAARADGVVEAMPSGLDSNVGRLFEGGHDLSGGEWQRLALARLVYRDADVWVLDEPTSALDPEAEAAIFSELRLQLGGRMGVIISHRFSTVRIADRIVVLVGGRVVEEGSHDELLVAGGRYAELFELQAAGYR